MKTKKQSFSKLVEDIHDNFNWKKVHKAMVATKWEWYLGKDMFGNSIMGVPDLKRIKNEAYQLLQDAYDNESGTSTGGFTAKYEDNQLTLFFTLAETVSE